MEGFPECWDEQGESPKVTRVRVRLAIGEKMACYSPSLAQRTRGGQRIPVIERTAHLEHNMGPQQYNTTFTTPMEAFKYREIRYASTVSRTNIHTLLWFLLAEFNTANHTV